MIEAAKLRSSRGLSQISETPGYYKWWAGREEFDLILKKLSLKFEDISVFLEKKNGLYCIYTASAVSESLRRKLDYHVNDPHSESRVAFGVISTLRKSISSIAAEDQFNKAATNRFIDKLHVEYFTSSNPIGSKEAKRELDGIVENLSKKYLYVLNLYNNPNPFFKKAVRPALRDLREMSFRK